LPHRTLCAAHLALDRKRKSKTKPQQQQQQQQPQQQPAPPPPVTVSKDVAPPLVPDDDAVLERHAYVAATPPVQDAAVLDAVRAFEASEDHARLKRVAEYGLALDAFKTTLAKTPRVSLHAVSLDFARACIRLGGVPAPTPREMFATGEFPGLKALCFALHCLQIEAQASAG